ncbi:hypothetical protein [Clostridium tagluense]|uniref:Uncharacterized protein n=1 Tax=Clostridium tagluense TaxID=360422 RepID=A0A401UHZ8_9CLOT|nr:hypothetical protein [Clostridium tagluense]GCD09181.1 hypothetical protein Ctaglu_08040 [Clostridium tagluense]
MNKIEELNNIQETLVEFYNKSNTKEKALNYLDEINNIILDSKDKRYLIKNTIENINRYRSSIFLEKLMNHKNNIVVNDKYFYFGEKDSYIIFIISILGCLGNNPTIKHYKETIAVIHQLLSIYNEPIENSSELVEEKEVINILNMTLANSSVNIVSKKNPLIILNFNMSSALDSAYYIFPNTIVNSRNNVNDKSPVSEVFMHEVGHALHIAITNNSSLIPSGFKEMFEETFRNSWNNLLAIHKQDVFADCFSIALSYNTKFEDINSFYSSFSKENRKTMYDYFDTLIRNSL